MTRREFLNKGLTFLGLLWPLSNIFSEKSNTAPGTHQKQPGHTPSQMARATVTVVGDRAVGKTTLIHAFMHNQFAAPLPPVIPPQFADVAPLGRIKIVDTGPNVTYGHTDVVVICYSILSKESYARACTKWRNEVASKAPKAEVILCATKIDMRNDPDANRRLAVPITREEGLEGFKRYRFSRFVETSALEHVGLKPLFDDIVREKMHGKDEPVGWMRRPNSPQ